MQIELNFNTGIETKVSYPTQGKQAKLFTSSPSLELQETNYTELIEQDYCYQQSNNVLDSLDRTLF